MAKVEPRETVRKASDAVRGVALRAVERFLLAHIVLRIPAKFMLGALFKPLFRQFQKVGSQKLAHRYTYMKMRKGLPPPALTDSPA
jgi:hypothetical protein